MVLSDFLARLEGVKLQDDQYIARCPAHQDKKASLSVGVGADGKILLNCFANCSTESIVKAMQLEMKDLFMDDPKPYSPPKQPTARTKEAEYSYAGGQLKKVKYRYADGSKSCTWLHMEGREWKAGRKGIAPGLYMSHATLPLAVFIVEGEKDVDTLKSMDLAAVSLPDGASSKWDDTYTEILKNHTTAKENLILYYLTMNGDVASAFNLRADELGYIGIKSGYQNEERAQIESLVMDGLNIMVEYAKGVVKIEAYNTATEEYSDGLTNLFKTYKQTYEQTYSSVSSWFGAYEKATYKAEHSTRDWLDAQKTQVDYFKTYNDNLLWLAENGLDATAAAFINMGEEGAESAEQLRRDVEGLGGVTSEAGAQLVRDTEDMAKQQQEGLEKLATTITEMQSPISEAALSLTEEYAKKLEGLDMSNLSQASVKKTMDAALQAIIDGESSMYAELDIMARNVRIYWDRLSNGYKTSSSKITSNRIDSRNAGGLDYVPYNGYISELHRGEMVLTEREATDYRRGSQQGRGNVSFGDIIVNYTGTGNTEEDIDRIAELLQFKIEQEAVALV